MKNTKNKILEAEMFQTPQDDNKEKLKTHLSLVEREKPAEAAKVDTRIDQLTETQLETYGENKQLVTLFLNGYSYKDAIKRSGSNRSVSSAQDLLSNYKKHGRTALFDKRWFRKPAIEVMVKDVCDIALAWYFERPAAGYRAIAELTADTCKEKGLPTPSESSVKRYLSLLPANIKLARKGKKGLKEWSKQNASKNEQNDRTSYANEIWQGDHSPPDIWVKQKVIGTWVPVRPHISAFIDDFSRACPGITVSTKFSDSWSISILSHFAFNRKDNYLKWLASGLPFHVESDCGGDWIGEAVQNSWKSLGISPIIDHPYYPDSKGKVERFFRTMDSNLLRKFPGHFDAIGRTEGAARKRVHELLTIEQLRKEIYDWVVNKYHQTIHSSTDRKPIELWEETVRYRPVENEDDLNVFLLKFDKERMILNSGIRLTLDKVKHRYWSSEFDDHSKRRVAIRYNPEDMESVLIYCAESGEFICEAWDMRSEDPKYNHEDVKDSRKSQGKYLKGIKARTKGYFQETLQKDRVVERQKEWEEVREIIEENPEPEMEVAPGEEERMEDLFKQFRQNDRKR